MHNQFNHIQPDNNQPDSQQLNYKLQGNGDSIVLLHGLFGNLDNLGLLARDLVDDHQVLSIDLRNHGQSFHSESHSYAEMANDVYRLLVSLNLSKVTLIGHSMGGKVAMKLAADHCELINKLIVMDMAPVAYTRRKHDNVFDGLQAVINTPPADRSSALALLAQHIEMEGVRQFLSKSLFKKEGKLVWRFNVDSILENYWNILGWTENPPCDVNTLFLKGADSDYITTQYQKDIQSQFPNAKAHVIANTGHWLHAEKPQEVLRAIRRFIKKQ